MSLSNLHFVHRFRTQAEKLADRIALRFQHQGVWAEMSWATLQQQVDQLSYALLANGIGVQENIAIFADNMPRWTITDIAAMQIRAVSVPIYATNTAKQAEYILNNAEIKILFVGDQTQYDEAISIANNCSHLTKIVAMKEEIDLKAHPIAQHWSQFIQVEANPPLLSDRLHTKRLDDLFTLIYTSGTTGTPKGVMLDYANLAHQLQSHDAALPHIDHHDVSLPFLPFSHIFERAWVCYVLHRGATNGYLENTDQIKEAMVSLRPTLMCAVPRLFEKIYTAVWDKVRQAPAHKQALFNWAVKAAENHFLGKKTSVFHRLQYALANRLVLTKLRQVLGGRIRMMPCGGAKLDPAIALFFHSIGVNVKIGYGMTETTASVSCWQETGFNLNSIGTIMPGLTVKIGEENEILVKGGSVMKGYYKNPEETAKAFTADGFLKTGDAGQLDAEGNLYITDRIKELMKTSTGKYIAPQYIEGKIGQDKFIEQIAIIADARKYVSALIVPCFESLEAYAEQLNIRYRNRVDLIKHTEIIRLFEKRLHELQKDLAGFEQIKKFTLLATAFSTKMEEITPTLKLRRKVILERYKTQIEKMYQ